MNSTCVKRVLDICRCSMPFRVPWEVALGIIPIYKNVLDWRAQTQKFPPCLLSHSQCIRFPVPNSFQITARETNTAVYITRLGNRMSPRQHDFPPSLYQWVWCPSPKLVYKPCQCVFHILREHVLPFKALILFFFSLFVETRLLALYAWKSHFFFSSEHLDCFFHWMSTMLRRYSTVSSFWPFQSTSMNALIDSMWNCLPFCILIVLLIVLHR